MLPDYKKLLKRKGQDPAPEDITCKNCETKFSGHFCPSCGQAVKEFDKPFSFLFFNFLGDFFAFDTRFLNTFFRLLFFPGKLTSDFFEGKRIRYAPPFRIFVFASFILFFLLQMYTNRGLTKVLDSSLNGNELIGLDSVSNNTTDSLLAEFNATFDSVKTTYLLAEVDSGLFENSGNIRNTLNKLAVYFENKLETETDAKQQARLREYIRLCRSPEEAWAKILKYMSWAFFFLLPVFALILKLFYIRRKQNYIRHLLFSVHLHSFIFINLFLIIALNMIFEQFSETITLLLFTAIPVYFILALKKFYGQNIGKVIVKFLGISIFYNIIFWFAVGVVFMNVLSIA